MCEWVYEWVGMEIPTFEILGNMYWSFYNLQLTETRKPKNQETQKAKTAGTDEMKDRR